MVNFNEFCGGPFWNDSQFLSSSWPQFTPCFMSTGLVWIPCGMLLSVTPAYFLWLRPRHASIKLPFARLSAAKLLCQMVLIIATFVLLLKRNGQKNVPAVEILTDVIKIVTFMTLAMFGQYERKKGVTASMLQFYFWMGYTLGQIIPAYSYVLLEEYVKDLLSFIVFYITFALCLALFFLNCWSEHPGLSATKRGYMQIDEAAPCPIEAASALSSFTFFWIFNLLRKGFRSDIQESEMWAVPHDLSAEVHSGPFEEVWKDEEEKCEQHRDKMYDILFSKRPKHNIGNGSISNSSSSNSLNSNHTKTTSTSVLDNAVYTERTRLTDRKESPQRTYTDLIQNELAEGSDDLGDIHVKRPSLLRVLCRLYGLDIAHLFLYSLAAEFMIILSPLMLHLLLNYLDNRQPGNEWQGYGICVLMMLILQGRVLMNGRCNLIAVNTALSVKTVLATSVYKKALRLKRDMKSDYKVGDIVNLMSVDGLRIQQFLLRLGFSITTPLSALMVACVVYVFIGPGAIVSLLVLVLFSGVGVFISIRQTQLLRQNLAFKDHRIRTLNEIFNGIKVLKLYAWEMPFQTKIQAIRSLEISTLLKLAYYYIGSGVMWNISSYLVTLVTFATFILSDPTSVLTPGTAFMILSYFNNLRRPLDNMAHLMYLAAQAYVSCGRIQKFMIQEELSEESVVVTPGAEFPVTFENAELVWDSDAGFKLKDINLTIPQGSLVAVVGPVGCGKSSILSAILGEMDRIGGQVTRKGTVAYVPQQAWIQNATVRDNITFGKVYRERKVKAVVAACQLERDIAMMSAEEDTEIGERGVNLSGGQKQRVSLARAVYHDCDLYLLDDPLSAVDSPVGKAIFNNVLGPKGLLKNKTRILVTHSLHVLPSVDTIVVMSEGSITEVGSYEELLAHDGPFAQFLKEHLIKEQVEGEDEEEDPEISTVKESMWHRVESLTSDYTTTSADEGFAIKKRKLMGSATRHEDSVKQINKLRREEGRLIYTEAVATGRVSTAVYIKYLRSIGVVSLAVAIATLFSYQAVDVMRNVWLTEWTDDSFLSNRSITGSERGDGNMYYLNIYAAYGIAQLLFLICFYYLFWTGMLRASRKIHALMVSRLFKAPMAFFDTTPIGRIINRCARDIEVVDVFLPLICKELVSTMAQSLSTILVILVATPLFGIVIIPVIVIFMAVLKFYIPSSRQLRRIENTTRSPIYSHFSESLNGAAIIRAFSETQRFTKEINRRLDYNNSFNFGALMTYRWMTLNSVTLSNLIVFSSSLLQVISTDTDPGMAGLTVSYGLQLASILNWVMFTLADFETNIVSVERIKEYSEVPQEAEWEVPNHRPSATWPFPGNIEFENFSIKYREGLSPVLKDISIRIGAGEKIGVVGRTGAGKSSLSLSLFRLMEATKGAIYVDGLNIANIGLHDLRGRLTILPQDPVLFCGSLRFNVDPFGEFTDEEVWTALARAHLKPFVSQLSERLEFDVGEDGDNLSVGIRQLVCLTRTLLRKTSILVLDEATSAVDVQTDILVQNTIRLAFQNCTVITIAHRIQTILDCDRVLVLEDGSIKEFDSPRNLLKNPFSSFYSMAADANVI